MQFNYFYGAEADQFNFIRVPKAMMKDSVFASLSHAAKLLYGLLLDRMSLSMKNRWFDEQNRVYIIYQITEIMDDLNITKKKAIGYLQELEAFGLVEKKRRGLGLPSYLYVKSFVIDRDYSVTEGFEMQNESIGVDMPISRGDNPSVFRGAGIDTSRGADEDASRSSYIEISGSVGIEPQEVQMKTPQNNTYGNNIDLSNTNRIQSNQDSDLMSEYSIYKEYLQNKFELEILLERNPEDKELILGMYDLILETLICKKTTICVAGYSSNS